MILHNGVIVSQSVSVTAPVLKATLFTYISYDYLGPHVQRAPELNLTICLTAWTEAMGAVRIQLSLEPD